VEFVLKFILLAYLVCSIMGVFFFSYSGVLRVLTWCFLHDRSGLRDACIHLV